jgi:hypothetical protein
MKYVLLFSIVLLTSCVSMTPPMPIGAGVVIIATDPTGCTFNDDGYKIWLGEGVPANYFTTTPQGHHITNALYHAGNKIRITPPAYPTPAPAAKKAGS